MGMHFYLYSLTLETENRSIMKRSFIASFRFINAFTLIELLIVVAIIAILAAIAVPNFLEAQTRAKVSRVKNDMRSAGVALESYMIDNNTYPWPKALIGYYLEYTMELSTPVAYLSSSALRDPFLPSSLTTKWALPNGFQGSYQYVSMCGYWKMYPAATYTADLGADWPGMKAYCVSSYGPDRKPDGIEWAAVEVTINKPVTGRFYDPTNGTVSWGDIGRFGGATTLAGQQ
jgi:prepilin-type N-terminal cleavage/methylation domain-containing protein